MANSEGTVTRLGLFVLGFVFIERRWAAGLEKNCRNRNAANPLILAGDDHEGNRQRKQAPQTNDV